MSPTKRSAAHAPSGDGGGGGGDAKRACDRAEDDKVLANYERWLKERGVWWDEELVQLRSPLRPRQDKDNIPDYLLDEWGIMTRSRKVKKGQVICRVPREACLGEDLPALGEDEDTQAEMASLLLKHRALAGASPLAPKLLTLPASAPVPWNWPEADRIMIKGTELEHVVTVKLARLQAELEAGKGAGFPPPEYIDACSSAISHANPWFGVSMVPFVDMGNHEDGTPHVEFRLVRGSVVGTALRSIPPFTEVTQSYGELGTADLMYRYGFARVSGEPMAEADVVSITAEDIEVAARGASHGRAVQLGGFEVMDHSPWDGLGDVLTVELSLPGESGAPTSGIAELLVAVYAMMLPEADWSNVIRLAAIAGAVLAGRGVARSDLASTSLFVAIEALESGNACPRASPLACDAPLGGVGNDKPQLQPPASNNSIKRRNSCPALDLQGGLCIGGGWAEGHSVSYAEEGQRNECARIADSIIERLQAQQVMGALHASRDVEMDSKGGDGNGSTSCCKMDVDGEDDGNEAGNAVDDDDDDHDESDDDEGVTWDHLVRVDGQLVPWLRNLKVTSVARAVIESRASAYPSLQQHGLGNDLASDLDSLSVLDEGTNLAMALRLRIVERKIAAAALASLQDAQLN